MDDSEILRRAKKDYADSTEALDEWLEEAEENYAFAAGDQWSDEDKIEMQSKGRPTMAYNRIDPFVDAVIGMEIVNRMEAKFIPRETSDSAFNEIMSGANKWARDLCNADDEETDAFRDLAICGLGWTETFVSYEEDPDGTIVIERRDPRRMRWDTGAKKRNLVDAKWIMYIGDMTIDEVTDQWPDADIGKLRGPWDEDINSLNSKQMNVVSEEDDYDLLSGKNIETDKIVRVARYQWKEKVPFYRYNTPAGEIREVDGEVFKEIRPSLEKAFAEAGVEFVFVKQTKYKVMQAYILGNQVLESGEAPCDQHFSYKAATGKRDSIKGTWYGIVRPMKDPQRWANKFLSTVVEIIARNAKGGLMAERTAFENPQKAEEEWASIDSIVFMKEGAIQNNKVMNKPVPSYPQGLDRLMQFSIASFRDVTGINLELMGLAEREQPGILEHQRKQAALTVLAWYFDAIKLYRQEQGRMMAYVIIKNIADGRMIRITGKAGEQYIRLMRQNLDIRYDVIVSEAPTSANVKERTWAVLMEMIPMAMKIGLQPPLEVLDYSPLPTTLIDSWKKQIQSSAENPEVKKSKEIAAQAAMTEIEKTKSETDLNTAKAEKTRVESGVTLAKD